MNEQSEFNSGIAYLQVMRELMNSFHKCIIERDYEKASEFSISLYLELNPRMDEKFEKEMNKIYNNIMTLLNTNESKTFRFRKLLLQFFKELNKFAHDNGLVMTNKDDAKNALQNGR